MANRDLLKEAIADAKALKETAIANAKAALEEAFEPRLKSMLSAKLEEMEKEELEEAEEEMTEAKKEKDEMDEGYDKEKVDEEMDLDEILAELEEGEEKEDVKEADEMDETIDEAEEDEEVEVDAEESEEDEDEEIDLEDMSEDDLKSFIEDVIADMVTAGELEAGDEFEVEDDEEIDVEDDTEVDVEVNEAKEEIDEAKEDMDEGYGKEDMDEAKDEMDEGIMDKLKAAYNDKELLSKIVTVDGEKVSMKDLLGLAGAGASGGMSRSGSGKSSSIGEAEKEEMDEMKKELDELRSELHETNLLNAKLLYTNKIFRAKNLKEVQKVKVLEAFDKASNVSEVKLIFETLNEGMVANTTKTPIKESLGRASKAAGVASKAPIVEVDPQVARWQKLAGIK